MRLIQVAKILGIPGQELRKELMTVDFGVKPTDREVTQSMAMGIIRFIANKRGITIDWANLQGDDGAEEGEEGAPKEEGAAAAAPEEKKAEADAKKVPDANLNVLRKLTLDDVPKEAIARQQQVIARQRVISKKDIEQRRAEAKELAKLQPKAVPGTTHQAQIKKKEGPVFLPMQISVKEFAEKTGIQVPKVIQSLMKNGILANINQQIDFDTASIIALELGVEVQREVAEVAVEALIKNDLAELLKLDDRAKLVPRAPIVTVMGHVDHGKTSILDAIRSTDVVAGEAGGITQHIGAYQVMHDGKPITFLDTPGHEAFTAMRARGAQVTDVAILVVSAEEGVKPTTIEAIDHVKDAEVPMLVAINKIDRPNADPDRVKGELAAHGLQAEEWGGKVPMIPCSALTKQGINDLLDAVLLLAEMEELKADPDRPAIATVIESHLDKSHGPLATVIVNAGTLRVGDFIASGGASGKVKALLGVGGKRIKEVPPSGPAVVAGLDVLPRVGDILQVFSSDRELQAFMDAYALSKSNEPKRGFADLVSRLTEGKLSQLKIVLKADAQGSLESLQEGLKKLITDKVQPKVIHAAIGGITESDVMMAAASNGIVVGFNVEAPLSVMKTADREGVKVQNYDIIYKLFEEMELLLKGLIQPVEEEKITGHLEVRGVFLTKKSEQIIGGKVTDGYLKRTPFRVKRGEEVVGNGRITSLKNIDKDIKEAKEGMECGMRVITSIPLELNDVLEAYTKEFTKVE
ncbi:MAG TPA: translation initiation factor IF-2 [Candidatus Peribacteria bacterium]|nr:translation initiation factor IF-2 [Candidatus Peribacteria bacterium]